MIHLFKKETNKLFRAFTHPTFIYLSIVGNLILFGSTILVYFLEKDTNPTMHTYFNVLWWGVSTITTVGYGDVVPITIGGRVVGLGLMISGAVLFVTSIGVLSSFWMKGEVERGLDPLEKELVEEERKQDQLEITLKRIQKQLDRLDNK